MNTCFLNGYTFVSFVNECQLLKEIISQQENGPLNERYSANSSKQEVMKPFVYENSGKTWRCTHEL